MMPKSRKQRRPRTARCIACLLTLFVLALCNQAKAEDEAPIEIANLDREAPVSFADEVMPILRQSCLACHNASDAASDLVLETPEQMLTGGALGPAIVPGKPAESLLLQVAAHQEEPFMPPPDNDSGAEDLTPEQLGILKLWIEQGAEGGPAEAVEEIAWQPLPPGMNPIFAVALSSDGQFAACSRANQIFIYHIPSGRLVDRLTDPHLIEAGIYEREGVAHLDLVQSLAFSPDGQTLASGGYRVVKLWRRPAAPQLGDVALGAIDAGTVQTSSDGTWLAAADAQHRVRLWNLPDAAPGATLVGHTEQVTALRFHPAGDRLVSTSADGTTLVWQLPDGQLEGRLDLPAAAGDMLFIGEEPRLVFAGTDQVLRSASLPSVRPKTLLAAGQLTGIALSPDAQRLAAARDDGHVDIITVSDGQLLRSLAAHEGAIAALAFADLETIASCGSDGRLKVWSVNSSEPTADIELPAQPVALTALANPSRFAIADTTGRVSILAEDHATLSEFVPAAEQPADTAVTTTHLLASPDGTTLYRTDASGMLRGVRMADGGEQYAVQLPAPASALALSPDGAVLATLGTEPVVHLWQAATGAPGEQATIDGLPAPPTSVAFTHDGQRLLVGFEDGRATTIRIASGVAEQAVARHDGKVQAVASGGADGVLLLTLGDGRTLRATPSAAIDAWQHPAPIRAIAAARTPAAELVTGGADGVVRVWDVNTRQVAREWKHESAIVSLAVRTDGTRVATIAEDQTARLWNAADGAQLAVLSGNFLDAGVATRLAAMSQRAGEKKDKAAAAQTAAQESLTARQTAVTENTTALEAATATATEALAAATKANDEKAAAETVAKQAADAAQAAADAKTAADKAATDTAALADTAAKTAASALAAAEASSTAAQNAAAALEQAKAALAVDPENESLKTLVAAAEKTAADTKAAADAAAASSDLAATESQNRKGLADAAAKRKAEADALVEKTAAEKTAADEKLTAATTAAETATKASNEAAGKKTAAAKALADAEASVVRGQQTLESVTAEAQRAAELATALAARSAEAQNSVQQSAPQPQTLAFSPDGSQLALAESTNQVTLYDGASGLPQRTIDASAQSVRLHFASARELVVLTADGTARRWDVSSRWRLAGQIGPPADEPLASESSAIVDRVLALGFSPDGSQLATGSGDPSRSGELKIWNVADGSLLLDLADVHSDTVFGVAFSAEGRFLASAAADKFVKVYDLTAGEVVRSYEGHTHHVLGVDWNAADTLLASCGADNVLKIWNFETGEQQRTIGGFGKQVTDVVFVADTSETLASAADKSVRLHQTNDGKNLRNYGGGTDYMYGVATDAGGTLVVAGGADGILRVWNRADGKSVANFSPPETAPEATQAAAN